MKKLSSFVMAHSSSTTVEQAYKTLRNHLRQVETIDSLYVIWAYLRNMTRSKAFPADVLPVDGFPQAEYIQKVRWTAPWDLEILAREVIIHSTLNLTSPKTFRNPNYFSGAVNKLKDIDGALSNEYLGTHNILTELERRLAHRQFDWQVHPANRANLTRYFRIFGDAEVSRLIEEQTGLSTAKIFAIGLVLWNHFTDKFSTPSITFDLPEVQQEDVTLFEKAFSEEVSTLRTILKEEVQINEKFNYAFHSLKRFPLLRNTSDSGSILFCPLPDLMFRQITGGIYYFVKWTGAAGNALGYAFQKYVGDVLNATGLASKYNVINETSYGGKEKKDTVDWIVANEHEALFAECKTKRVTFASKEELLSDDSADKDLEEIAEAVFQVYKSISDYRKGEYPTLDFSERRDVYPVVVTMEEWFLMGNSLETVRTKVEQKMTAFGLPAQWIEEMPFSICSIEEFELLVRTFKTNSMKSVIEGKQKDPEMRQWAYAAYLNNKYSEVKNAEYAMFPDVFREILPISIGERYKDSDSLE